ncbi:TNF receptor-associated factor family protein DDB_G0272098-like [Drosophila eugracilis]|uniref:TNF receptor-associated factor family protein DDB_G0272098-like n=1 Tax=Drosophila eugracilis TaxID=29029 RepID=UPI001BDB58EB|nr:TNF receptor-associated factor family protein DDB_G0272098-like [Drosophila eugracilis]
MLQRIPKHARNLRNRSATRRARANRARMQNNMSGHSNRRGTSYRRFRPLGSGRCILVRRQHRNSTGIQHRAISRRRNFRRRTRNQAPVPSVNQSNPSIQTGQCTLYIPTNQPDCTLDDLLANVIRDISTELLAIRRVETPSGYDLEFYILDKNQEVQGEVNDNDPNIGQEVQEAQNNNPNIDQEVQGSSPNMSQEDQEGQDNNPNTGQEVQDNSSNISQDVQEGQDNNSNTDQEVQDNSPNISQDVQEGQDIYSIMGQDVQKNNENGNDQN